MTEPGASMFDSLEKLEEDFPWGILGFIAVWVFLFLTYWL